MIEQVFEHVIPVELIHLPAYLSSPSSSLSCSPRSSPIVLSRFRRFSFSPEAFAAHAICRLAIIRAVLLGGSLSEELLATAVALASSDSANVANLKQRERVQRGFDALAKNTRTCSPERTVIRFLIFGGVGRRLARVLAFLVCYFTICVAPLYATWCWRGYLNESQ